jgi:hypothetical protein
MIAARGAAKAFEYLLGRQAAGRSAEDHLICAFGIASHFCRGKPCSLSS